MNGLDRAAIAHGNQFAHPEIRSMYPSESRSVVAHCHAKSFLAGARWGLERAAKEAEDEARSETGWALKYAAEGSDALSSQCTGGYQAATEIARSIRDLLKETK